MGEREDLRLLLMAHLDGELEGAERERVERALASDAELRAELERLRRLLDLAGGPEPDARSDAELEAFWNGVYNRLERRAGWLLLTAGAAGLGAAGLYLFFASSNHWAVKAAGACGVLGAVVLLLSVLRERLRALPHDRYSREVRR